MRKFKNVKKYTAEVYYEAFWLDEAECPCSYKCNGCFSARKEVVAFLKAQPEFSKGYTKVATVISVYKMSGVEYINNNSGITTI